MPVPMVRLLAAPAAESAAPARSVLTGGDVAWWWMAGAAAVVALMFLGVKASVVRQLRRRAQRTRARWDDVLVDMLGSLRGWLLAPVLIDAAVRPLLLPPWLGRVIHILAIAALALQLFFTLRVLVNAGLDELVRRARVRDPEADSALTSSLTVIRVMALGVAAVLVALAALDNLGVQVTPLITGLGIGGVAVALAVQNILTDLFASLSIILDRPFVVGDFIVSGSQMGTVEKIGLKTTRVRALSGEQLVFSNSDLLSSRIQNFKRMQERRVEFRFSVPYATPTALLDKIPATVRRALADRPKVRFDRCHLKSLGEYDLVFECVYIMQTPDFNVYMDTHHALALRLLDDFAAAGVRFAVRTPPEISTVPMTPPLAPGRGGPARDDGAPRPPASQRPDPG